MSVPARGDTAPDFEALLSDGETFRGRRFSDVLAPEGGVLVFSGFAFSAVAENWWKRYDRADWDEFDVPVVGVTREGPYAQNEFLRQLDSPFDFFADVDGEVADAYGVLTERAGMAGTRTANRAVFVLDGDRTVQYRWLAENWTQPPPREEVEEAVAAL
ncbi:MAG: redoxin domain-containing protein [Haloarculaceae archaeon]